MDGFQLDAHPAINLRSCRNILVVKLDFIGDWVLCTPFLHNLRYSAPEARITAVVLERVFDLAATSPDLDRVVALRDRRPTELIARRPDEAKAFLANYASRAFDLAMVPRWDADFWGAAAIAAESGAEFVVGFSERCTRRKRFLNRGDDRLFTHVLDNRAIKHELERNLDLLRFIGGTVRRRRAALHLTRADEKSASDFLQHAFGGRHRPIVALAPFASTPKRKLSAAQLIRVARSLRARYGCGFVILGDSRDAADGSRLASEIPGAVSAAGHLTLREVAALLRGCTLIIGADSGPGHIAAAVGTPVLVLSCHPGGGPADHPNSPVRFAPWDELSRVCVLQPVNAFPPCIGACIAGRPHCILAIPERTILREATRLIEHGRTKAFAENRTRSPAA